MLYFSKRFYLFLSVFIIFSFFFLQTKLQTKKQVYAIACNYRIVCVDSVCGGKNYVGRPGTNADGTKDCSSCYSVCDPIIVPTKCMARAIMCTAACGQKPTCVSDGCGGQTCCGTKPCAQACTDTDGGSFPNVFGKVVISSPALPQTLSDTCMILVTKTSGATTTTQWVAQSTGTHVAEKTCTNTQTGAYADSIIACPLGCTNGACNTTGTPTSTPIPTPTSDPCRLRSVGDSNCNLLINDEDFVFFRSFMNGVSSSNQNISVDFNKDGGVNMVDYEIWRNTMYK